MDWGWMDGDYYNGTYGMLGFRFGYAREICSNAVCGCVPNYTNDIFISLDGQPPYVQAAGDYGLPVAVSIPKVYPPEIPEMLAEGEHSVNVQFTARFGGPYSFSKDFYVDNTPPLSVLERPQNNVVVSTADMKIVGHVSDSASKVGIVTYGVNASGNCLFQKNSESGPLYSIFWKDCSSYYYNNPDLPELSCDANIGIQADFTINKDLMDYIVLPESGDCQFSVMVSAMDNVRNYGIEVTRNFILDLTPPFVSISTPASAGWPDPDNLLISGMATDAAAGVETVWLTIHDDIGHSYWNGSSWVPGETTVPASISDSLSPVVWKYEGLTKEHMQSGMFTITVYARDKVGLVGQSQVTNAYKKRYYAGEKVFTGYTLTVKEVKNADRAEDDDPYSFVAKEGKQIIGVSAIGEHVLNITAEIVPFWLEAVLNREVTWNVSGINSVSGRPDQPVAGNPSKLYLTIPPIVAISTGRGAPMKYEVSARVEHDGTIYRSPEAGRIYQDDIDQCRQEYIDMGKLFKPLRSEFVNATTYIDPGDFSFGKINIQSDYSWAIFTIAQNLQNVKNTYSKAMPISSGYRNPIHNKAVGGATNSEHIYGLAADIDVDNNDPANWDNLCSIAIGEGACVEPYSLASNRVHMDWRPGDKCVPTWPQGSGTVAERIAKCKRSH